LRTSSIVEPPLIPLHATVGVIPQPYDTCAASCSGATCTAYNQKTHPTHRAGIKNGKLNRAAFAPTADPRREMERVGLRGMLDLSGLSARKIHFKSWIRDKISQKI
jgi:hypothetical protein